MADSWLDRLKAGLRGSRPVPAGAQRPTTGDVVNEHLQMREELMRQLQQQGAAPAAPQPAVLPPTAPAPMVDYSKPDYGGSVAPALDALQGYGNPRVVPTQPDSLRSINPTMPRRRPEDEEIRLNRGSGAIRG